MDVGVLRETMTAIRDQEGVKSRRVDGQEDLDRRLVTSASMLVVAGNMGVQDVWTFIYTFTGVGAAAG